MPGTGDILSDIKTVCYILVLISLAIGVLLYFLSKIFQHKSLENSAKENIIESLITGFLVIIIFQAMAYIEIESIRLSTQFIQGTGIAGGINTEGYDLVDLTLALMKQGPFKCLLDMRDFLNGIYFFVVSASKIESNFKMLDETGSGSGVYEFFVQNLIGTIFFLELVYFMLFKMLIMFKYVFFPLLFPAGVALRAFLPTRGIGAFLMALSISFYFVFPYTYVFALSIYPTTENCAPKVDYFEDKCDLLDAYSNEARVIDGASAFSSYFGTFTKSVDGFLRNVMMAVCLFPFIAFGMAVFATSTGSTILGAKMPEIGRGLVKFI